MKTLTFPIANGTFKASDVTVSGTNTSDTHNIYVAFTQADSGYLAIQYKKTGVNGWVPLGRVELTDTEVAEFSATGEITDWRFIVADASGTGSIEVTDSEKLEDIHPLSLYGETGGMSPDEIGWAVTGAASSPCSAGALMAKILNDSGDGVVFVCSDSTGNDSYEWVYLYAQWVASISSKITVKYYKWNISSNDYDAPETISTGVGGNGNTISIYNAAIPGSKISYLTGAKYGNSVGALPFIDLIILNHGHNHVTQYATSINSIEYARTKQFHDALSVFQRRANNAGVIVLTQNPYRDDDNYAIMYATLNKFAESVNADVADSYSKFVAKGKSHSLYIDNAHPSADGSELFLAAVKQRHMSTTPKGAILAEMPVGVNILPNGGFESFSGSVPDDWTQTNATTTKELAITRSLNGYSVKIEKTAGGSSSYISQNLSSSALKHVKGRYVTLNVQMYIPNGAAGSTGRISLLTNTSAVNTTALNDDNQGGWISKSISVFVKDTDTYVTALIYSDSSTGASSTLYVDSAAMTIGTFPVSAF